MDDIHITLLRHGRSRADDEDRHEGRYDAPLTDVGRAQAARLAAQWVNAGTRFDTITSSTLGRALETANILGQALKLPVDPQPHWMELDNGPLAGLTRAQAAQQYQHTTPAHPFEPYCGTGESEWDAHSRAAQALQALLARGPGRRLVVAHGGIINAALRVVTGAPVMSNGAGVAFSLGDLGHARLAFQPRRNLWWVLDLVPHGPEA